MYWKVISPKVFSPFELHFPVKRNKISAFKQKKYVYSIVADLPSLLFAIFPLTLKSLLNVHSYMYYIG